MSAPSPSAPPPGAVLLADGWQDFEVLDAGGGLKLERWGPYRLVRPDPQAIWPRGAPDAWKAWDGHYHRSKEGGGRWEFRRELPEAWEVAYGALRFRIRPTGFKHTGLFPEQAANWDRCAGLIRTAGRPLSVLNLFGYTGAATLACAAAGAAVCHVDAAQGMVQWCRDNAALSGLADAPIRYIVDDCVKFVKREQARARAYDALILDPPSYGRGKQGEFWKIEEDLAPFLALCAEVLSERPRFVLLNGYTTGFAPSVLGNLLHDLRDRWSARHRAASAGTVTCGEIALPLTQRPGRVLPCGTWALWAV